MKHRLIFVAAGVIGLIAASAAEAQSPRARAGRITTVREIEVVANPAYRNVEDSVPHCEILSEDDLVSRTAPPVVQHYALAPTAIQQSPEARFVDRNQHLLSLTNQQGNTRASLRP